MSCGTIKWSRHCLNIVNVELRRNPKIYLESSSLVFCISSRWNFHVSYSPQSLWYHLPDIQKIIPQFSPHVASVFDTNHDNFEDGLREGRTIITRHQYWFFKIYEHHTSNNTVIPPRYCHSFWSTKLCQISLWYSIAQSLTNLTHTRPFSRPTREKKHIQWRVKY